MCSILLIGLRFAGNGNSYAQYFVSAVAILSVGDGYYKLSLLSNLRRLYMSGHGNGALSSITTVAVSATCCRRFQTSSFRSPFPCHTRCNQFELKLRRGGRTATVLVPKRVRSVLLCAMRLGTPAFWGCSTPAVDILQTHDVVLTEVATGLHLD